MNIREILPIDSTTLYGVGITSTEALRLKNTTLNNIDNNLVQLNDEANLKLLSATSLTTQSLTVRELLIQTGVTASSAVTIPGQTNIDDLIVSNIMSTSVLETNKNVYLDANTSGLYFDYTNGEYQKTITWDGDFVFRTNNKVSGGNEVYTSQYNGVGNNSATKIQLTAEGTDGKIELRVADNSGNPGDVVDWTTGPGILISSTANAPELIEAGTGSTYEIASLPYTDDYINDRTLTNKNYHLYTIGTERQVNTVYRNTDESGGPIWISINFRTDDRDNSDYASLLVGENDPPNIRVIRVGNVVSSAYADPLTSNFQAVIPYNHYYMLENNVPISIINWLEYRFKK